MRLRVLLCGVLGAVSSAALLAQPIVSFEDTAVVARGIPPGSQAVLFGIAREPTGYFTRVVRRQEVFRADSGGQVRMALERAVPWNSIWFAVDLTTGAFGSGRPQGSGAIEIPFPGDGIRLGTPGRAGRLASKIGFLEILYVRPARGVWSLTVGHGGENDDPDTRDHDVSAALDRMVPIGSSPPAPSDFAAGDVVLLVDPRQLQYFATRVGTLPAGGAQ